MRALFISHEASATGAPIFFLEWLKWFKQKASGRVDIQILILKDGEIHDEFCAVGKTLNLARQNLKLESAETLSFLSHRFDYVHLNTIESTHALPVLLARGFVDPETFVVNHIHELEGTIQKYGPKNILPILSRSDLMICVSLPVKENLVQNHGFPSAKMIVIPPCARAISNSPQSHARKTKALNVLGCGEITVGKGIDVFIRTAIAVRKLDPRIEGEFLWLGADNHQIQSYLQRDLDLLHLNDFVRFLGFHKDVSPFFSECDLFFMCSRQDSFPLVCLEATSIAKPILYFPDAGGIKAILGDDGGFPLPYLDENAAARTILNFAKNPEDGIQRGKIANKRWLNDFQPESIMRKISENLREDIYETLG